MMSLGLVFWILMLLWFVFGIATNWPSPGPWLGNNAFTFILLVLLGWKVFGAPISGS